MKWRRRQARWKPARRRMDWQTPVILALLVFSIALATFAVLDKHPSLLSSFRRDSVVPLNSIPSVAPAIGIGRIIDGDTVVATSGEHYRLVGFDTPEKDDLARCDSERLLAMRG